jgi:hypothetical protein
MIRRHAFSFVLMVASCAVVTFGASLAVGYTLGNTAQWIAMPFFWLVSAAIGVLWARRAALGEERAR